MKKIFVQIIFSLILFSGYSSVYSQIPHLQIHHIGAGDGDATLILLVDSVGTNLFTNAPIWDTCTILIDGQREGGGKEVWRYVNDTVRYYFPNRLVIDAIIVSHLHIDHYGGLINLITNAIAQNWKINKVITRAAVISQLADPNNVIDSCYSDITVINPNSTKVNTFFKTVRDNNINQPAITAGAYLYQGRTISIRCIVSVGAALNNSGGVTIFLPETYQGSGLYKAKNENDLSYGFLVAFQGFHYVTMGDLAGVNGSNYVDGESFVTKYLDGYYNAVDYHLCSYKVSHHGSAESTTEEFARLNNPFLAVIPASLRAYGRSTNPLPTQTAITNLQANPNGTTVLYTFIPNNPSTLASWWTFDNLQYLADIILKISATGYPESGDPLPITVVKAIKNSSNYAYLPGGVSVKTYKCTKGHDW